MKWWSLALVLAHWLLSTQCFAAVHRFALVIGNNDGGQGDITLQYAESDASKVSQVLRELGGFTPANTIVLAGETSATVRSTLIDLNARIRAVQSSPADQALLFVYYSGHADAKSLRLGSSRLAFSELAQLVRGSSATFRLLVVDACRSGKLTRVKGGQVAPPFELTTEETLPGQGVAFLTASSANEDAQESDEIRGSFFTHALVSGLLGAADTDNDGTVVLEEAYRHARDATVRATSRTFAGIQHPTFHYEIRGQDSLVLTRPSAAADRSQVAFPPHITFLIMNHDRSGAVVGEVDAGNGQRQLSLKPGRYFVRGRGADYLLEGVITVGPGETRSVNVDELTRAEFAQWVRKGAGAAGFAQSLAVGAAVRTPLPNASTACLGAQAHYQLDLEMLSLSGGIGACTSEFKNATLTATTNEYLWTVQVKKIWDVAWLSLAAGAGAGATLTHQHFTTEGRAPDRLSLSPLLFATLGATVPVSRALYVALEGHLEGHLAQLQESALVSAQLKASFAMRSTGKVGVRF